MQDVIHEQLIQAKKQLRRKQKLDAVLAESQFQLRHLRDDCRRMERVLDREKTDVDNLEGFTLTGLFYAILGTKEQRLEKERQEYLAAKLKHDDSVQAVEAAERDIDELCSQLAILKHAESEYARRLAQKEQFLSLTDDKIVADLVKLSDQTGDLEADRKELEEAISAGMEALQSLQQVRSELQSASNWGTIDILGGGTATTWMKHTKIDAAKRAAHSAQVRLRQFQKELADADQRLHVSLGEIGGFMTFADYFFDGLIIDWTVQSKIHNASAACEMSIEKVKSAIKKCRRRLEETEGKLHQVGDERRRLIEEA